MWGQFYLQKLNQECYCCCYYFWCLWKNCLKASNFNFTKKQSKLPIENPSFWWKRIACKVESTLIPSYNTLQKKVGSLYSKLDPQVSSWVLRIEDQEMKISWLCHRKYHWVLRIENRGARCAKNFLRLNSIGSFEEIIQFSHLV